jgi:hypothetical protein
MSELFFFEKKKANSESRYSNERKTTIYAPKIISNALAFYNINNNGRTKYKYMVAQ